MASPKGFVFSCAPAGKAKKFVKIKQIVRIVVLYFIMELLISKTGHASKPFLNRIKLIQGDIIEQNTDAIAIVVPQSLDFKGKMNEKVSISCGRNLDEFILENIYKPRAGDVYALPGFDLPAKHILVGIMPVYRSEADMSEGHLSGVCRKMMEIGRSMLLKSISFPPIASGRKCFPKPKAARLMIQGITDRFDDGFEEVRLVCPDAQVYEIFKRKLEIAGNPTA